MTAVLTLSVILFGVMSYLQLPVNDLPAVDYPVIQVNVGYPGASPDTVANNIATPLERQFMQINGLEVVTSRSTQGFARCADGNLPSDQQSAPGSSIAANLFKDESERSAADVHRNG
jgi:hypothetical protein